MLNADILIRGVIGLLQGVFPAHITGIQQLDLKFADEIKVADEINIHLYIQNGKGEPRATTIITPHSLPDPASGAVGMVVSLPEAASQAPIVPQPALFSSGIHLIFNQHSWWQSTAPLVIGQLAIMPAVIGEGRLLKTFEGHFARPFRVVAHATGAVEASIWQDAAPIVRTLTDDAPPDTFDHAGSTWSFQAHRPTQFVSFEKLPHVVLSFDAQIVQQVITITRRPQATRPEYHVLVVRHPMHT